MQLYNVLLYVFPVTSQRHLQNSPAEKNKKTTDKEMQYLDRQIRRADLEIEILEHKLEVGAWSQNYVNYFNYWNIN